MQLFKVGQQVRARVIGARPLDGLSVLSLKLAVVDQQAVAAGDLQLGATVTGEVLRVTDFGLLVKLGPGTRFGAAVLLAGRQCLTRMPALGVCAVLPSPSMQPASGACPLHASVTRWALLKRHAEAA